MTIQASGQKRKRLKKKQRDEEKEIDRSDGRSFARKGGRIPGAWRRMPVAPSPVNMDESQ